jgi:uncharacterized protein YlxP (DUF503 family)
MIVGAAVVELHVHDSGSLKAKRGVVRRILGRVRSRFPVSAAEVGGQGTWQRAVIGLVTVGNDARKLRAVLEDAVSFVESLGLAEVTNSDVEILRLPVAGDDDAADEDGERG